MIRDSTDSCAGCVELQAKLDAVETRGTLVCPICGFATVHPHEEADVRHYASNLIARFGYRVELISPVAYTSVRDKVVDGLLKELRSYAIDACDVLGGDGRLLRQTIATIERLMKEHAETKRVQETA